MRIVERHFYNKTGDDQTYFVRMFGRARKFHRHGAALDTQAELVEAVSSAYWEGKKQLQIVAGTYAAWFWRNICKVRCLLDAHGATRGGYIVLHGELKCLWCDTPGQGTELIRHALADGAHRLNCFDGFLVGLCSQFGFEVVTRQPNWASGEPDVVTMELSDV